MKQPKILFFIDGPTPTAEETLEAYDLQSQVVFRNAQHVFRVDEECDGVAGDVPAAYINYPTAEEALESYKDAIKAARARLAEVGGPAPLSTSYVAYDDSYNKDLDRNASVGPTNNVANDPNKPLQPVDAGMAPGAVRGDTIVETVTVPPVETFITRTDPPIDASTVTTVQTDATDATVAPIDTAVAPSVANADASGTGSENLSKSSKATGWKKG